ncbi:hypothetical protein K432DRAFT_390745 [Lepidopterella palustris CBS 459.81]|uniref:Uncharacterized protein n=1 Tax=Lepidopterella palustris CBS 459.81 TaxID=1314670 RepID=A0A8E2EFV3_9PEZI|nr:hypothetical protein K432DRAFT_390745 [Lepidopterella palustris CBS 459.81]
MTAFEEYDLIILTLAFCLNLGRIGVWNGSIALMGDYDSSRVNSSSWISVPACEDYNGSSKILQNGTYAFDIHFVDNHSPGNSVEGRMATLVLNSDAMILPSTSTYGEDLSFKVLSTTATRNYLINIAGSLMDTRAAGITPIRRPIPTVRNSHSGGHFSSCLCLLKQSRMTCRFL